MKVMNTKFYQYFYLAKPYFKNRQEILAIARESHLPFQDDLPTLHKMILEVYESIYMTVNKTAEANNLQEYITLKQFLGDLLEIQMKHEHKEKPLATGMANVGMPRAVVS